MSLKTSFCNKSIIKSDFKRLWWIPALHTILLFLTGTMIMLNQHFQDPKYYLGINSEFSIYTLTSTLNSYYIFALIVPVILGAMLFSYMQTGKAATFAHSLPVTRGRLYISHIVSGVIMYTIPLLINVLILLLLRVNGVFADAFSLVQFLRLTWEVFLLSTVAFAGVCFVSFITGNAIASIVFTYIFGALPAVAEAFAYYFAETQLFGYAYNYDYSLINFLYVDAVELSEWKNTLLYIVIAAVLFGLGYLLYRLRHVENHGEVVAFPKLRPVFIYGVGICSGCLGFAYFCSMWNLRNALLLIPLGILGIVIAQMIVKKSFKVPEVYKPIIGYTVIVLIVFAIFNYDLTGYERRIPDADDIEYVTFSMDYINSDNDVYYDSKGTEYYMRNTFSPDITDKTAVEEVRELHKYLVINKNAKYNDTDALTLTYKLNNGKILKRRYDISLSAYKEKLEPIIESDVIRQQYFPILRDDGRKINTVSIYDHRLDDVAFEKIYPSDRDFERIIKALKKDLTAADYDEYAYRNGTFTYLNISFTRPGYYIDGRKVDETKQYVENETYYIRSSYVNTISILKELGIYENLPTADDVEEIYINYFDAGHGSYQRAGDITYNKIITDREDIELVMDYISEHQTLKSFDGSIDVLLKDGRQFSCEFSLGDENLPDCLK